jgi:DNA polymerase-3 subunit delta'
MAPVSDVQVKRFTLAGIPYQRGIAAALARALAGGRLAHAYLFAGPRGVGKEAIAYALGAAALCREEPGVGCGTCNVCRRLFADLHPDFRRYEAEGMHFDLERVREILAEAGRPPSEAPRKILLVVEPEKMTYRSDAPANAFLKTLEEPPGRTTFVLVSHDARQLLPTVRSRCVTVHFPRLRAAELEEALARDYGLGAAEAAAAAARADGTLAGAAAAGAEAAEEMESALALLEEVAAGGVAEAFAAAQLARGREEALALVNALAELSHELAAAAAGAAEALRYPAWEGRYAVLLRGGRLASPERAWEELARAGLALRDNCNVALTLEELFLGMAPRRGA